MKHLIWSLLFLILTVHSIMAQTVGSPAPNFTLTGLDGKTYTLSELKNKVVYVFLFGADCPLCRQSAPNTESGIHKKYMENPNFVALGIDTWDRSNAAVINFRNQTGLTYPLLTKGSSVLSSYSATYDRNLVINGDGTLIYKGTGPAGNDIAAVATAIEQALSTASSNENTPIARNFELMQNYPNPFNPSTSIRFTLQKAGSISLAIYSVDGRLIQILTSAFFGQGDHTVQWNGENSAGQKVSSGIYVYQLSLEGEQSQRRLMTLIK